MVCSKNRRSLVWGPVLLSVVACGQLDREHDSAPNAAANDAPLTSARGTQRALERVMGFGFQNNRLASSLHGLTRSQPNDPTVTRAFLRSNRGQHLVREEFGIAPLLLRPSNTRITLPTVAADAFRLRNTLEGVEVHAELVGAQSVAADVIDGLVVYPHAGPGGATVVHRATESGTEDFIELAERPERAEVSYRVRLMDGVAGLRLVSDTLEFVDVGGSPSLRVAPPSLVTSQGQRVVARLDVRGCAVDRDQSAPWARTPVPPGATECTLAVSWDNQKVTYPALLDPAWVGTGSLAAARSGASAVTLPNGWVLVVGGMAADQWTCLDSAELYNPATRTFAATGSLAVGRCQHTAVRRANGTAIVMGGSDTAWQSLASTEVYDLTKGTWSSGPPLSVAHTGHRSTLLSNGDVLVAGGDTDQAERLASTSTHWVSAGTLTAAAWEHTLTSFTDGRALLVSGSQSQWYAASTNGWYPAPSPIAPYQTGHTATRLNNGQVLVVGSSTPSTELFDPTGGVWQRTGVASAARYGHSATLLSDGRVLLAGGVDSSVPSDLSTEVYDPAWGILSPGPSLVTPRRNHAAALLPSGRVLVAGGLDSNYFTLASAEEFDPTATKSVISEYKLPAKQDNDVNPDAMTELWASVTRPAAFESGRKYPLLVFLHGNHGTCGYGSSPRTDYGCEYTYSGMCPSGWVVTPNHRGYDYITSTLAARGYVVVSINANRGINCTGGGSNDWGLNLARGRLILRHLEQLSAWNRGVAPTPSSLGFNLANRLDLSQVGLFGHSRGGEGVRAAYQQYRDAGSPWPSRIVDPVVVRGIFEVGPVDGQSSRVLNAEGTRWNVLLPMCDGDVSDLEGIRPFDRMITNYSTQNSSAISSYTVWGANHNFYNTEWQESDSGGCMDHRALFSADPRAMGSAEQRQTALRSVSEFFAANVGVSPIPPLDELFNPERVIASDSVVERGYGPGQAPTTTRPLDDFTQATGKSMFGISNVQSRVTVQHRSIEEHDSTLRAATIRWTAGDQSTYFQINFANPGGGLDLSGYQLLDFRAGRQKDQLNVADSTSLAVTLVHADNSLSATVNIADYGSVLLGPVGGSGYHQMLVTVRIPLAAFGSANLSAIRGVRFAFPTTPTGAIYLANVRATRSTLVGSTVGSDVFSLRAASNQVQLSASDAIVNGARPQALARKITSGNRIASIRTASNRDAVEFRVVSSTAFTPRGDLLVLQIGDRQIVSSGHPEGSLKQAVFVLDRASFDTLRNGDNVTVQYAHGKGDVWELGVLDKALLNRN